MVLFESSVPGEWSRNHRLGKCRSGRGDWHACPGRSVYHPVDVADGSVIEVAPLFEDGPKDGGADNKAAVQLTQRTAVGAYCETGNRLELEGLVPGLAPPGGH